MSGRKPYALTQTTLSWHRVTLDEIKTHRDQSAEKHYAHRRRSSRDFNVRGQWVTRSLRSAGVFIYTNIMSALPPTPTAQHNTTHTQDKTLLNHPWASSCLLSRLATKSLAQVQNTNSTSRLCLFFENPIESYLTKEHMFCRYLDALEVVGTENHQQCSFSFKIDIDNSFIKLWIYQKLLTLFRLKLKQFECLKFTRFFLSHIIYQLQYRESLVIVQKSILSCQWIYPFWGTLNSEKVFL